MATTAILIDGGFYRRQAKKYGLITSSASFSAEKLYQYCFKHLKDEEETNKRHLYRIFYYDCPPLDVPVFHPLSQTTVDMKISPTYTWTNEFFKSLRQKRKVAQRLGTLSNFPSYLLKPGVQKALFDGSKKFDEIKKEDFVLDVDQKGVDMRIGLDIASLSYKRQVDQIILIAGDSDFLPAVKHARREGIDVILDTMGHHITDQLAEHVDGMQSHYRDI